MTTGFNEVQSTNKLSPECRRAIGVLGESLKNWEAYYIPDISRDVLKHNSRWFFATKITKDRLPDCPEWNWNQSNGKQVVMLDNMYTLELFKYNPIRKFPSAVQPSYKLWLGHIKVLETGETFSFLWCEKGQKQEEPPLTLQDLSFLSEFADPAVRREFGWA